jgi:hypothetical protein
MLRCEKCTKEPAQFARNALAICGGCNYAVCPRHSKKLFYRQAGGLKSASFCIFGDGTYVRCQEQFVDKFDDKDGSAQFGLDWLKIPDLDATVVADAAASAERRSKRRFAGTFEDGENK